MQNDIASHKKLAALLGAFVLLLSANVFLQFDFAEQLFDELFSSQTIVAKILPSEVCGSRAQISASVPCGASWNILPGIVGSTSQNAKLQLAHVYIGFSTVDVSLQDVSYLYIESYYKDVERFAHSGLSPPLA